MNSTRQLYLKNEWNQYPFLKETTLTVRDFVIYFAKLNSGEKKIKNHEFWIAGRLTKTPASQDGLFNYQITSQEETLSLDFQKSCRLSKNHENFELLETGDQVLIQGFWSEVQVEGFEVRIQRVFAHQIELLAPSFEHYSVDEFNYKKSKQWQFFLQQIRKVFQVLDFTEVHTPSLLPAPGTEPFLDFFKTEFKMGSTTKTFYLPTSPELHLKKMIAAGWCRVYEMKNCFRNGEVSEHHQPEFWMLEWYRAYSNLDSLVKDLQGIINFIKLHWPEPISGFGALQTVTVQNLFRTHCDFELTPTTTLKEMIVLAKKLEVEVSKDDSWNDLFFKIFLEKIERQLGYDNPTIVRNYPPSQAALARLTEDGWADRFELYWNGLEIANAFHELNDPEEQLRRFHEEISFRKEHRGETIPMDEEFIKALRSGFPPTAGIALGLDRLFMALTGLRDISKTRAFSLRND